ncbi:MULTISPECIES: response regulator transcription factor [Cycloclasticus]|jgi:DNA-binding NarL/FixJ family response regulator|uniref:Response regulator containing a CheY-like receiver domain and an HTH DNA-binding domain, LuxR family n=1 Tax=Cycloclasticus zancles 78-ME TaxID=1198232 RepID=S5T594_9GAMM|nr:MULTISPECIES: response regulator transcription factor [Cycloclasticus]AGS38739.1 Response regulator containing a CheY-like receiver domain and an HTH DNA-binding domain, LuxR family [Cycloclasticus zancles 78-ME]SHI70531.1 DNA-binding response regulator, NarL/FixJ family, contains REC and HTH domains [Cycloclasticus pugetii]
MNRIAIYSDDPVIVKHLSDVLSNHFDIFTVTNTQELSNISFALVDSQKVDTDIDLITTIESSSARLLIVGGDWSENQQVNAFVHGVAGYCCQSDSPKLIVHAVTCLLQGDTWIQRHLVPLIIEALIKKNSKSENNPINIEQVKSSPLLATLSSREKEVAKMVSEGESNKLIANNLNISERTVKAHLTSIFKKLQIPDRLHLALLIKEL